jgi:hypothetical protein
VSVYGPIGILEKQARREPIPAKRRETGSGASTTCNRLQFISDRVLDIASKTLVDIGRPSKSELLVNITVIVPRAL